MSKKVFNLKYYHNVKNLKLGKNFFQKIKDFERENTLNISRRILNQGAVYSFRKNFNSLVETVFI